MMGKKKEIRGAREKKALKAKALLAIVFGIERGFTTEDTESIEKSLEEFEPGFRS